MSGWKRGVFESVRKTLRWQWIVRFRLKQNIAIALTDLHRPSVHDSSDGRVLPRSTIPTLDAIVGAVLSAEIKTSIC